MYPWYSVSQLLTQTQGPRAPRGAAHPDGTAGYEFAGPAANPRAWGNRDVAIPGTGSTPAASGVDWENVGLVSSIAGGVTAAIGALASVRSEQNAAKSQELSLQFDASMSALNARAAEREAQTTILAGEREAGATQLQAAAAKSASRADAAARGVLVGAGSAADLEASIEFAKESDVMAIRVNAAQAAGAARTRGVNASNTALLDSVSGRNIRRNAGGGFTAATAMTTSLLFSTGRVASQLATDRRRGLQ